MSLLLLVGFHLKKPWCQLLQLLLRLIVLVNWPGIPSRYRRDGVKWIDRCLPVTS
jgi:hypothetical protein